MNTFIFHVALTVLLVLPFHGFSQTDGRESHIEVAMRMIGHEVLLLSGDSNSRVLPIQEEDNQYHITFESDFSFNPDELAATIDRILLEAEIASWYIVEVKECDSAKVVYSYERRPSIDSSLVPCLGRNMPSDCYSLLITLLSPIGPIPSLANSGPTPSNPKTSFLAIALVSIPLMLIGLLALYRRRKPNPVNPANVIAIGDYQFDERNMELFYHQERMELTSKEVELLQLLYTNANSTIERTDILKQVWGDEGAYVGRTLDVYVSKLRKKLAADPKVKIVNIRGVGYKMVLNG